MRKRRHYSEKNKAARREADKALKTQADAMLSDPIAVAELARQVAATTSQKILRYSLRNNALIFKQAQERGMRVSDVDNYRGWRNRGRYVREDEHGLRIVAPQGRETANKPDNQTQPEAPGATVADDQNSGPDESIRFRMTSVFNITQTEGIEDFEGEAEEPAPVEDPVVELRASLAEQIERQGYAVTTGPTATVDHEAATVTVPQGQPVEALAQALASLLTAPAAEHRPARYARQDAAQDAEANDPSRVRLDLGPLGVARAELETNVDKAAAYYRVSGPNFKGMVSVLIEDAAEHQQLRRVRVIFGKDDGTERYPLREQTRTDLPRVFGVEITGVTVLAVDNVDGLDGYRLSCRRTRGGSAPTKTADRAAAVVAAIVRHYTTREDVPALWQSALVTAARQRERQERAEAAKLDAEIERLIAMKRDREASAADYRSRIESPRHNRAEITPECETDSSTPQLVLTTERE